MSELVAWSCVAVWLMRASMLLVAEASVAAAALFLAALEAPVPAQCGDVLMGMRLMPLNILIGPALHCC